MPAYPLEWYKDRYKGERLFVCGNAPSLAEAYPLLKDEYTFGCNYIFLWDELPFPPTFYGVTEPRDRPIRWEHSDDLSKGKVQHRFYMSREKIEDERSDGWTWLPKWKHMQESGCLEEPPFATALTTPINIGVQFGIYMGFQEINVVGVEFSHYRDHMYSLDENGPDYGYLKSNSQFNPGRNDTMTLNFIDCGKVLAKRGGVLRNCTPHGWLAKKVGVTPLELILNLEKA